MKHYYRPFALVILFLGASMAPGQDRESSVSAHGSLVFPSGSLANRFVAGAGGGVNFFLHRGTPHWGGGFEYFKFSKLVDGLSVNRPITDTAGGIPRMTFYQVPIPRLTMSLEVFGATVQARYEVARFGNVFVDVGFGAGIYRWSFTRNEYRDSLRVQTPNGERTAAVLNVPALEQRDWSGGFNVGTTIGFLILDPVSLNVGARYKLIIGELWPTLALDLESVSTFQMLDLRAGLSIDF